MQIKIEDHICILGSI